MAHYLELANNIYNELCINEKIKNYNFPLSTTNSSGRILLPVSGLTLSLFVPSYLLDSNSSITSENIVYETLIFRDGYPFSTQFTPDHNRFTSIDELVRFIEYTKKMTLYHFLSYPLYQ